MHIGQSLERIGDVGAETNVPGPRVPIYMAGAQMVVQYGTGPIFDGMGLIHPVYSYGDRIAVSFVADREVVQVDFQDVAPIRRMKTRR